MLRSCSFLAFVSCFSFVALGGAHAELSINPYPLTPSAPAISKPQSLSKTSPPVPYVERAVRMSAPSPEAIPSLLHRAVPQIQQREVVFETPYESHAQSDHSQSVVYADPAPVSVQWQAFRGAYLPDVVTVWAERAGVEVLWDVYENVKVPDTLSVEGSFEEAIEALLAQYDHEYIRPVGNLHVGTGGLGRTLVIVSHQGA